VFGSRSAPQAHRFEAMMRYMNLAAANRRKRLLLARWHDWKTLLSERLACSEGFPIAPGDCNWTVDWPGQGVELANGRRFYFPSREMPYHWHPTPTWLAGNVGGGRNQELAVGRPSASQSLQLWPGFSSDLQGNAVEAAPGPFAAMPRAASNESILQQDGE
jgi:hypothetical protein